MMKKHILLGLMALCLAGGVGTTLAAVTVTPGSHEVTETFDQVIELNWGSGSSTASISPVEDLRAGEPQYRSLEVTPKSSKSVAGTVTLTFTISVDSGYEATGLTLKVYKTDDLVASNSAASVYEDAIDGLTASPSLAGSTTNVSGTTTFAVSASSGVHETNAYYVLKFETSGAPVGAGNEFGADITISQSFAAA